MSVSSEQLTFFLEASSAAATTAAGVAAVVVMIHIPLYFPELLAEGKKDGLTSTPLDLVVRRHIFATPADTPRPQIDATTDADQLSVAFADAVKRSLTVVAVLCGHIHGANAHPLQEDGNCWQDTADAGCYGSARVIDFVPASSTSERVGKL
eukprot:SAG31_NODE_6464_length_2007_cov_1.645702_2_plen_152_part_00